MNFNSEKMCKSITVQNGIVIQSGESVGDTLVVRCNKNYRIDGSHIKECLENGNWSGLTTKCISKLWINNNLLLKHY